MTQRDERALLRLHPEIRKMAKAALSQGWTLTVGGSHVTLVSPTGKRQPLPGRSDKRRDVVRSQLRKAGVTLP